MDITQDIDELIKNKLISQEGIMKHPNINAFLFKGAINSLKRLSRFYTISVYEDVILVRDRHNRNLGFVSDDNVYVASDTRSFKKMQSQWVEQFYPLIY